MEAGQILLRQALRVRLERVAADLERLGSNHLGGLTYDETNLYHMITMSLRGFVDHLQEGIQ